MATKFISGACVPVENAWEAADDLARTRLALLCQLEASLEASRKALLALDLASIERGTCEQVRLTRELEGVPRRSMAPRAQGKQSAEDRTLVSSAHSPELGEELKRCESRILGAARLQAALLVRSRYKLRVLANMLAGQSVDYGPLLARNGAPRLPSVGRPGGEI